MHQLILTSCIALQDMIYDKPNQSQKLDFCLQKINIMHNEDEIHVHELHEDLW